MGFVGGVEICCEVIDLFLDLENVVGNILGLVNIVVKGSCVVKLVYVELVVLVVK